MVLFLPVHMHGKGQVLAGLEKRSEEHTSELQSRLHLVCRLLLEKKNLRPRRCRRSGARPASRWSRVPASRIRSPPSVLLRLCKVKYYPAQRTESSPVSVDCDADPEVVAALRTRSVPQGSLAARLREQLPDRRFQLRRRDGALELGLDPAVPADEEGPRLRLQAPLSHPAVVAECRPVLLEDFDVNEADAAGCELATHAVDDVYDRPTGSARAEARGREGDDKRLVGGQRGSDRVTKQGPIRRHAGSQLRDPAMGAGERGRGRSRRLCADRDRIGTRLDVQCSERLDLCPDRLGDEPVAAGAVNAELHDVDPADPPERRLAGARRPDRLEPRGRALERAPGLRASEPDPGPAAFDRPRVVVDDEEREPDITDSEVRVAGDDGHVLARPLHQRPQRAGSTSFAWRPTIRPAAYRNERDENGQEDGARGVRLRRRPEDVRAWLGRPLNPGLQGRRERSNVDKTPRTRV